MAEGAVSLKRAATMGARSRASRASWNRLSLFGRGPRRQSSMERGPAEPPRVRTSLGCVEGKWLRAEPGLCARVFLGIPFAKAPLADLRFQRPRPPDPWPGVLSCRKYRSRSMQASFVWDRIDVKVPVSEDCLYLNVIAPEKPSNEFPNGFAVMVYIHGGGYVMDSAAKYHYSKCAKYLTKYNVIVVTIQYRLGLLGYLCLDDEFITGNYGLWDQIMALKFINENIAKFGGDPNRITVFGQSAGGASTDLLSISPICMAGNAENNWAVTDRKSAIQFCRRKVTTLGFKPQSGWDREDNFRCLQYLSKLPSEKFGLTMLGEKGVLDEMRLFLTPVYDSQLLPKNIEDLRSEAPPMDTICGVCRHEGLLFLLVSQRLASQKLLNHFEQNVFSVLSKCNQFLPPAERISEDELKLMYGMKGEMDRKDAQLACVNVSGDGFGRTLLQMMDDFIANVPTYNCCNAMVRNGARCYYYMFDHFNPALFFGFNLFMPFVAATHCTELAYVFDVNILVKPWIRSKDDDRVRHMVTTMWTNFAKYGNPNSLQFNFNWEPVTLNCPQRHLLIRPNPILENSFQNGERLRKLSPAFKILLHEIDRHSECLDAA